MENERIFHINDNLRIAVRNNEQSTYVIIESNNNTVSLDVDKWKKFRKWFPIVDTEFNLRLQNIDKQ